MEVVLLLLALVLLIVAMMVVPIVAFRFGQWLTERFRR